MKLQFFAFATNETAMWSNGLPAPITKAYGVYVVCHGEGTHVCSLTPQSRADFLCNEFVYPGNYDDLPEAAQNWLDEHGMDNGGELSTYFGFIDRDLNLRRCSELREFECDPDEAEPRETLWRMALEDFNANSPSIPVLE